MKDQTAYLSHIIDAIEDIQLYASVGRDAFMSDRMRQDADKLKSENPNSPVPVDLVTTSGSGLDPDISPEAAYFQIPRIAKARSLAEDRVRQLVAASIEERTLGLLGEPTVNVLALNLALDKADAK